MDFLTLIHNTNTFQRGLYTVLWIVEKLVAFC
jgi:hypothetical protein